MTRPPTLAEARAIIRRAEEKDPEALRRLQEYEVVKGIDFSPEIKGHSQPGFGGQSPRNAELIAQRQQLHEQNQRAELAARARRAQSLEEQLKLLEAGQAPENLQLIRSSVNQG